MDGNQVGLIPMTPQQCEEFVDKWREKPVTGSPRSGLRISDGKWEYIYQAYPKMRADKDSLIFRIHYGGDPEPEFENYSDWKDYGAKSQKELFDDIHKKWEDRQDPSKIRFDGHWVSFTKDPKPFMEWYYASKCLRGLVIVLRATKAVDISPIPAWGNVQAEQEVVAPMDRSNLVEILPFNEFKQKYCKRDGQ